ncbi:MAG: helix-turn-helix domain-containing protein [Gammaproteobacteria bacterium]|nr:helix-turn-helix domain-containing protein [Gammaproteobacteria bacterium]
MRIARFVESYFEAWNQYDPEGVADHLTDDGYYCDVPQNLRKSHEELVNHLQNYFLTYPHRYELIGDILTGESTIAFQYRSIPENTSRGFVSSYNGAEFMTLDGDAAVSITDYYEVTGQDGKRATILAESAEHRRPKYAKSGLSDDQLQEIKLRMERIMRAQQLFLRSDLTLPKLAATVGCSVNHLSQVINAGCGMSFFEYLNKFRVDYAKKLLSAPDSGGAILNIAFTVGFNSNSAFYTAFKKCVGQTPAHYRRTQLERSH